MRKIANTTELTGELQRLLEYAGSHQPSRVRLAAELRELATRVAGDDDDVDKHLRASMKQALAGDLISEEESLARVSGS